MDMLGKVAELAVPSVGRVLNFDEKMKTLKRKLQELRSVEADTNVQLRNEESFSGKKRKNGVENWLANVGRINNESQSLEQGVEESSFKGLWGEKVEKMTKDVEELIEKGRFQGGLVLDGAFEMGDEALPASELEGQAFQTNKEKILECLMKEEIFIIGIYGMGGVGKTTLVTHIHNELCNRRNAFPNVYWITVSQDFSIYNLQQRIAKTIGFDLSNEDDERKRAAKLSKALKEGQKFVIILDDLWDHFHPEEIGLPVRVNGCKLILTTRSSIVCCRMSCQEKIHVNPLSRNEAWRLFQNKLGEPLSPDVIEIAQFIAKECAGLPLGIVTMAGSMRGVDDICEWRNALRELKESKFREDDMKNKVFQVLKFSYNRLTDSEQKCFLYCALYPEDYKINREALIGYLIDEGIIKEMKSRQAEFDEGHSILNRLEKVCLLECDKYSLKGRYVKMHDLVRDMAIQIMESNLRAMVQGGKQLTKMPNEEEWTKDLVRCSLVRNHFQEIPFGYSPRCPKLTTLLLFENWELKSISTAFFEKLDGLKVLDLSGTGISELPSSISYLVNLSALLLRRCFNLSHVPSLAELRVLKRLDLNFCYGVVEVPRGIELLSNLRYLDLQETEITEVPPGILPKLSNLQFLNLGRAFTVRAEEVASLTRLETLVCRFDDVGEFNAYNKSITSSKLIQYHLVVEQDKEGEEDDEDEPLARKVTCFNVEVKDVLFLPKDVQALEFHSCDIKTNGLCLENATELKSLEIKSCDGMGCLLSLSSSPCIFQSLEEIRIEELDDLQFLFSREATSIPLSLPHATFSLLKKLDIFYCRSLKKLFPPNLLPNLQNLEYIYVHECFNMVELIGTQEEEEEEEESHESSASIQFTLPKLKTFELRHLVKLKSICRGKMICNSLQHIQIVNCQQLKKMPLSLVLTDSGQPIRLSSLEKFRIYPWEWWKSVELDHPNAKDLLFPLCEFSPRWH